MFPYNCSISYLHSPNGLTENRLGTGHRKKISVLKEHKERAQGMAQWLQVLFARATRSIPSATTVPSMFLVAVLGL